MVPETITSMPIRKLKLNSWGDTVGPPLSDEDYEALKLSIRDTGVQIPLVVWAKGRTCTILSGANRLRVARELGMKTVPCLVRQFPDERAAKLFALTDNLARRQLNTGQRAYLAYQYQQLLSVGAGRRTDLEPLENSTKVDARQAAAEKAGVSSYSVSAMKTLIESGDDDLLQDVLSGRQSVSAAARYLKYEAREARVPEGGGRGVSGIEPPGGPVYTVVRGDSSDLIAEIARIYLKPGAVVCDVTIGLGVFWQKINIDEIELYGTDIAMEKPVDLRKLPYADGFADVLVLDPPHQHDASLPITGARYCH
ncbi:MAG TPA: ParB N-terminal domain-containing protein [Candidatus Brocadiia bacterium]|nr:ParB N-terminal domain-containing protein [Candidatus Brocadiia bacterium]